MKDSGMKNYRIECQYETEDYDGPVKRRFFVGDFLSDIEISVGDHLAFSGGTYPENVPGFYIGKVVGKTRLSGNCCMQMDFIRLTCFNELENTRWKCQEDIESQMEIVNKIRARENTFFARLMRGFSEKPEYGLYKADI